MGQGALKIAVSGYYGCGNTGDEAVLAGVVESFRLRAPDQPVDFTVLSADPEDTERRHALSAVPRMKREAVARVFQSSDLLLSGGGSLLQDTTSLRSLVYYLWIVQFARRCGAPVMFYAQGIGPLRRRSARILTRIVADRVARITVRDPASAELLRSIGVRRPPIAVTADPAFALNPAPGDEVRRLIVEADGDPDQPFIGVSIRPWRNGTDVQTLTDAMVRIADTTGLSLLFLPMQPPGDLELSRRVASSLGERAAVIERPVSPTEAVGIVSRAKALVAMRLHALIFGAATGVPIVGLAYDPKVEQLMEMAGQSSACIPLRALSADRVADAVQTAVKGSDAQSNQLRDRSAALRQRALENVDHALLAIKR